MSELKMASPARALELAQSARPELTQRSFVTTMDYRMVDGANNQALAALREAFAGHEGGWASWSGELRHPPKPESVKHYYPIEEQGAWIEPVSLRLAVFENEESGVAIWLVETPGKNGASPRLGLWVGEPGVAEWKYYRSLEQIDDGLAYLARLADADFVKGELARLEREELDKTTGPAGSAGSAPRV